MEHKLRFKFKPFILRVETKKNKKWGDGSSYHDYLSVHGGKRALILKLSVLSAVLELTVNSFSKQDKDKENHLYI